MTTDLFPASDFDAWAETYDQDTSANSGFPFDGYSQALERAVFLTQASPGQSVLDLGAGTGNLSARFAAAGCQVWGTDYSTQMLELARKKVPQAKFVQADLREPWPAALPDKFDRIVSGYTFHHFDTAVKVRLIASLAESHLTPGGRIVILDIAFPSLKNMEMARRQLGEAWNDEYYWIAEVELPALRAARLSAVWQAVPPYAGIFTIQKHR
jgi:putative AdoMet-dependent methyltransferase